MKIKPLGERILVERYTEPHTSKIILAGKEEKSNIGIVKALGSGRYTQDGKLQPFHVKPGDKVFFGKYSGIEFENDQLLLKEEEILGILQ